MFHEELYDTHNDTLDHFIELFNECYAHINLVMLRCKQETFEHDGLFIDTTTARAFGFDWTRSKNQLFTNSQFKYKQLACIESKLNIQSSKLLITTDRNENNIAVAWHDDFMQEKISTFLFQTNRHEDILRQIRYTSNFKTYAYAEMATFKKLIQQAINTETYNKKIFINNYEEIETL